MTEPKTSRQLAELAVEALEDLKAREITVLEVGAFTSVTDVMIIASGTSDRHVKAIADNLIEKAKKAGVPPLGVEGEGGAEWVLVDLGDVIVHVMLPQTRAFYSLEKLWSAAGEAGAPADSGAS